MSPPSCNHDGVPAPYIQRASPGRHAMFSIVESPFSDRMPPPSGDRWHPVHVWSGASTSNTTASNVTGRESGSVPHAASSSGTTNNFFITEVLPDRAETFGGAGTNALFPHARCTSRALVAAAALALAGCAEPPGDQPALASAEPPYGPLVGGTKITLHGENFDPTARVLVGSREAPLAFARTSNEIDVVIPPGDEPGDA